MVKPAVTFRPKRLRAGIQPLAIGNTQCLPAATGKIYNEKARTEIQVKTLLRLPAPEIIIVVFPFNMPTKAPNYATRVHLSTSRESAPTPEITFSDNQ
ncbi:MAG: hypothetical protein ONB12_04425 [candidate division KSB1 bacterium]|nr:hypothetical protein [candidate division KSB1 bacterium]